ncbi:recombinase RecT [uncultured Microbacterium sp.]|uniref:recombinase RecT n=1 Tax=uncultured Microbacterium sp. TaxID=191216 RepID=UPI0025DE5200|nr:recombinase RecT [uncultured Microbacterium sp.]
MSSTELTLPTSVRPESWNPDTAAMMEFAGLTWVEQRPDPENPGIPRAVRMYAPPGIMAAFIAACARTGLDPTAKQIYAAQMGGKWTVLVGIDGMRVVAQRTGEYDGQDPIEWQAEEGGPWTTVPPKSPFSARVRIYRKGISRPLEQTVTFAEFGSTAKGNWTQRPSHMLGIRAESHGFRRQFPMELAGLYTPEDFESGLDTSDAIIAQESEPWSDLIHAATTRAELEEIKQRIAAADEGTDKLRAAWLARAGAIAREEDTVDADVVEDDTDGETSPSPSVAPEDYDAAEAARFDAAVENGEVLP